MDMELTKKKIDFYDTIYQTRVVHEENIEIIVPDASPDMVRVVCSNGYAYVKEKSLRDGALDISGMVSGCVLYIAEGDNTVRKIDVNMPFNHSFESSSISRECTPLVCVTLVALEAREINSRKIALRAHIAIEVSIYHQKNIEVCCDVMSDSEYSIEIQNKEAGFYAPVVVMEKSFTVMDDVEIPQSNAPFEAMLTSDVALNCNDMKIIGNKAIIKGTANIKYTYNTKDGTVAACSHELPYSQIMDIDGSYENCDLITQMSMRAAEIEPAHDMSGDTRYISVNILVDACVIAYGNEELSLVCDLYSTSHDINAQFEKLSSCSVIEHTSRRTTVNENIETACSVKRVIDSKVILEPIRYDQNRALNDITVNVYYIGEDDTLYCATRRCNAECTMSANDNCQYICDATVSNVSASGIGNEITVRFFVDYDIKVMRNEENLHLTSLSVGKKREQTEEPSVIVKYIYNDQPIWNIAKSYNTTIEEIAAANSLDLSEVVTAGSTLLIPRKG